MTYENYRFSDVAINYDRVRVPLSSMERAKRQGQYRYYGAQGVIDYVDDYLFDGTYMLIAEDGENLKSNKQNIAQIVSGKFWVNNHAHIIQTNKKCNLKYLCYLINSMDLSGYITGSAQPKLSQANLNAINISLPIREVQDRIVSVLNLLDDKIKLNKRINENLEQQIDSLYKSWFINFDPFDGSAPLSWEKKDIYSIARIIYGAPFSSKLFNTEGKGLPIIRIRDLKDQAFVTYTTEQHPKAYLIKPGDIVVGMDGEFRPYLWGNSEALLNQRVCVFENLRSKGKAFLLCTLKPLLYRIEQTQVATTVIHIGKKDYDAFELLLPDSETLDKFDEITSPAINLIVNNSLENKRLAFVRDSLLPKLMSGELDVSEIDL